MMSNCQTLPNCQTLQELLRLAFIRNLLRDTALFLRTGSYHCHNKILLWVMVADGRWYIYIIYPATSHEPMKQWSAPLTKGHAKFFIILDGFSNAVSGWFGHELLANRKQTFQVVGNQHKFEYDINKWCMLPGYYLMRVYCMRLIYLVCKMCFAHRMTPKRCADLF